MSSSTFSSPSSSLITSSLRSTGDDDGGGGSSLSFRKSDGSTAGRVEILRALRREGSSVSEILCEEIEFGDEDVAEMERLLIEFQRAIHLTNLELSSNGLTPAAGRPLASILTVQHETLIRLNLSKNPLSSVGFNELIEILTLQSPPSRLEYLNLSSTHLGPRAAQMLASLLRNNRSIQVLLLSNNALGAKTIKVIAPELASNPSLKTLDLSYNSIKHKGASSLAKAFNPYQNSMISTLKVLDISGNKIAAQGMQALCEALAVNRCIEELRLGTNNLEKKGAAYLAHVLKYNYTLKILDLQCNDIGPDGASLLIEQLMEENQTLESLNLAWNGVGSIVAKEVAQVLKRNESLTNVDLKGNDITSDGVSSLAEALSFNTSLRKLNLMHNKFDKVGAFALVDAVGKPTCPLLPQNLLWDDNPAIGEEGAASLSRVPQLRRNRQYWLGQLIQDVAQGHVFSIDFRHRIIGDEEVLLLVDSLRHNHTKSKAASIIRSIWLAGATLRARSLVPLFETCVPSPANIIRLYLKDCENAGDETTEAIATALPQSKSLQVLCLCNCGVTPHGAVRLAQGLRRNTSLRRLNLDCNCIGDSGLTELASVLPHPSLTALSANNSDITDDSMRAKGLTQIQELSLENNRITNKGALWFAENLHDGSCCLTWMRLQGNEITKEGGETVKLFLPKTIPGGSIMDY
jgi:Ran GTPase-activating protein (RanGAP) involved in mRNA processing and transport